MCRMLLAVWACSLCAAHSAADCSTRPQDDLWLISTRHIHWVQSGEVPELRIWRQGEAADWHPAGMVDLAHPAQPDQIVVVYVHGNRVSRQEADVQGRYVYQLLTRDLTDPTALRFVIWSWPSDQQRGPLRDARAKAERTELSGYCLGWFLAQLPEHQRVSLLGYSFGARIATGALHLVGGGQLSGRVLPEPVTSSVRPRVVMVAAALHNTWLLPGGYHDQAPTHLNQLLNLYNSSDPVLKRYRALERRSRPTAAGFSGLALQAGRRNGRWCEQLDVRNLVQRSHAAIEYYQNPVLRGRIQEVLLWR